MERSELLWKQYEQHIITYKFYLEMEVKLIKALSVVKPLPHGFNDLTCDKVFIGGHQPGILNYRRSKNNPVGRIFINRLIKINR